MRSKYFLSIIVLVSVCLILVPFESFASQLLSIFPGGKKPNGLVFFVSVFLGLIVSLSVHELGHLLSGIAQGFRFELFVVFLLGIKRTDKGIRVFLNKNLGYMGGIAATIPTVKSPKNRRRFALMVLAGPLASLIFAAVCLLFLVYTRNALWSFWLVAFSASIGLFLATTIPSKTGIYFTDRARFQRLISKGKEGESEEALLSILAQTTIDNSCKNISLEDAHLLQADKEPFIRFWGHYYEYEHLKEIGQKLRAEEAKGNLLGLKEAVSNPVWKALKLE